MSSLIRSSYRVIPRGKTRSLSSSCSLNTAQPSVSINDYITNPQTTSSAYLKSSVSSKLASKKPAVNPVVSQLHSFSHNREYDSLLEAFLTWTSSYVGLNSLKKTLSPEEISYFLNLIVKYQKYLLYQQSRTHLSNPSSASKSLHTSKSTSLISLESFRYNIRDIYSKLLFGSQSSENVYGKDKRDVLYTSANLTGYKLNQLDYENLILHELYSKKIDLASKWFQRYEQQYDSSEASSEAGEEDVGALSHEMWLNKFKVYSWGAPFTWEIPSSDVYQSANKERYRLKSQKRWEDLLQEYMHHCATNTNINSTAISLLDDKFCQTIIYSSGHAKNLSFLQSFINRIWGIDSNGQLDPAFSIKSRGDPRYPDLETAQAIVIAFSYNREFYKGMMYVNAFQEHYGNEAFNLSSKRSIPFWNTVLDWAEKTSRFSKDLALKHYLKSNSLEHLLNTSSKNSKKSKRESDIANTDVENDADFDQQDFQRYIEALQADRIKQIEDIWSLYRSSNTHFSAKIFNIRLKVAKEFQSEDDLFDVLKATNESFSRYHTNESEDIYLEGSGVGDEFSNYSKNIFQIHVDALKALIDIKGKAGLLGQIPPLIEEWSLSPQMTKVLRRWYVKQEPVYKEMLEEKREQVMIKQKSEKYDDEEAFLDLF